MAWPPVHLTHLAPIQPCADKTVFHQDSMHAMTTTSTAAPTTRLTPADTSLLCSSSATASVLLVVMAIEDQCVVSLYQYPSTVVVQQCIVQALMQQCPSTVHIIHCSSSVHPIDCSRCFVSSLTSCGCSFRYLSGSTVNTYHGVIYSLQ